MLFRSAKVLLKHHDINCCSKQDTKHLKFQCGFSKEEIIMGYHCYNYAYLGAEQVEQFVIFMGASEIESFMTKYYETCIACNDLKSYVSAILDHCLEYFSNNPYIIDYKERLIHAQECTHNLQEPEKETAESGSSLDEKEEESDEQKEEEWISYPCIPSNESNFYLLHYLIVPHAYQRRMNVMFLWILLKYLL